MKAIMIKISDYKLAESLLRAVCGQKKVDFLDLEIQFDNDEGLKNSILTIPETKNLGQTMFKIVSLYMKNMNDISGTKCIAPRERHSILIYIASLLRNYVYSNDSFPEAKSDDLNLSRLYQRQFVWTMMKDVVCPLTSTPLRNMRIVSGGSAHIDIAKFYDEGEAEEGSYPFIFMNTDIENDVIKNVFVLIEAIKAHGLCPVKTINDILHSPQKEQFMGLVTIAFVDDEKIDQFLSVVCSVLQIGDETSSLRVVRQDNEGVKMAQSMDSSMMWWYLGIMEKMLQPARGTDWSVHESLEAPVKEFWDKVERVKEERGSESVPFNMLLRLKSDEHKTDTSHTLEHILGSDRIW
tara:strand:- start:1204 stop:2256 length:1053 start_codon:yes stop_codon:yes gene_type:complete